MSIDITRSPAGEGEKPQSLYLYLMSDSGVLYSLWLPETMEGRYRFENSADSAAPAFLHFEQKNGVWTAFCSRGACFSSGVGPEEQERPLSGRELLEVRRHSHVYSLYIEPGNDRSSVFHHYQVRRDSNIVIGSAPDCDIVYPNPAVSPRHARLCWDGTRWTIHDEGSRHGVYCNGRLVSSCAVQTGDVVFIMGLRILIGAGFLAMNAENARVSVDPRSLRAITAETCSQESIFALQPPRAKPREPFNCSPRKRIPLAPSDIVIEGPPMAMGGQHMPLLLRMGSSMVMSGSAALAGNYTMLLTSLLFPFLSQRFTEKERREYEEKRQARYGEYLQQKQAEIEREKTHEEYVLKRNYPEFKRVLSYPLRKQEHLWERRKNADDFLQVRVGSGEIPLFGKIDYPMQRFNLEDDVLEKQMYALAEAPVVLEDVPILFDLVKYNVSGIVGERHDVIAFLKQLMLRICLLHSYDEVKLVFLGEETLQAELSAFRFLPHFWDDERNIRFIAADGGEACQISEYLKGEVEEDLKRPRELKEILKQRPYYIVCATSKKMLDSVEVLKDVLTLEKNCGVTILAAFDDLPKECSAQIDVVHDGPCVITYLRTAESGECRFVPDAYDPASFAKSMKALANTQLRLLTEAFSLPKSVSLLELFNVGRVEHLNPHKRWQESNPVLSLAVPIGVSTDGTPLMLDLHQKAHGPHGLVAGMTGSGKSEFLLSYIVSLAINFHPDEVAFVLIDYKGGGLAGAFDDPERGIHLPHLVATITNLDGSTIQRSLMSIQSELTRRQRVFSEAKSLSNEGTIDIYSYQRMYRNRQVSKPMPHLFIICDEFAELKQQQPEFMDQLISIARIGRSLGIHLILATQKPSGIVNEQIRSNTKFRVCLKVQDKSDSMDMLMRPEAAGLRETGRFYLQVGYNEQFSLGQSAWSGAPYQPQDTVVVQRDESVQFLDSTGQSLLTLKPQRKQATSQGSQLLAVVQLLSHVAAEQGLAPRSLWRPALPAKLSSAELEQDLPASEKHLRVCLGRLDDPAKQEQFPLLYDFNESANLLIVGGPGCGKSTLIHSILRSLLRRFAPEQFQFYAMDFSGRLLKLYSRLPHCGGVLMEEDSESFARFFDMIQEIITERKRLFSQMELNDFDTVNAIHPLPLILVMIDNLSGLGATKAGENLMYKLPKYIKDGLAYGVKFIVTDGHLNSVPSRIRREINDVLPLHLKDKYDYSDALGCKTASVPPDMPGRGMYAWEGRALELQLAMDDPFEDEKTRSERAKEELSAIAGRYAGRLPARRLPVIDPTAEYEDFAAQFRPGRIPLGFSVGDNKAVALPLKQFTVLRVYCGDPRGVVPITENFLRAIQREQGQLIILRRMNGSVFDRASANAVDEGLYAGAEIIDPTGSEVSRLWQSLDDRELTPRRELHTAFCREKGLDPREAANARASFSALREKTRPLFLLFESFADFCSAADMLSRLVFGGFPEAFAYTNCYMICFFEPDDDKRVIGNSLYYGFDANGPCMLFGGRYDHQQLCEVHIDGKLSEKLPYNVCLMHYQRELHPLLMPCGVLPEDEDVDEDEQSIF